MAARIAGNKIKLTNTVIAKAACSGMCIPFATSIFPVLNDSNVNELPPNKKSQIKIISMNISAESIEAAAALIKGIGRSTFQRTWLIQKLSRIIGIPVIVDKGRPTINDSIRVALWDPVWKKKNSSETNSQQKNKVRSMSLIVGMEKIRIYSSNVGVQPPRYGVGCDDLLGFQWSSFSS